MCGGDWDDYPISKNGIQVLRFSTHVKLYGEEGRSEWHGDFVRGAMESYERLGHVIDRLRLLIVDVESVPIVLGNI